MCAPLDLPLPRSRNTRIPLLPENNWSIYVVIWMCSSVELIEHGGITSDWIISSFFRIILSSPLVDGPSSNIVTVFSKYTFTMHKTSKISVK